MIRHKEDSIAAMNEEKTSEELKDKTIAEQGETIELLKGCIMELAAVIYGEGGVTYE